MNQTLNLPLFNITITFDDNDRRAATLVSTMTENEDEAVVLVGLYCIESMILAHFCAGVDVTTESYLQGIQTAYDALSNHIERVETPQAEDGFVLVEQTQRVNAIVDETSIYSVPEEEWRELLEEHEDDHEVALIELMRASKACRVSYTSTIDEINAEFECSVEEL